MLEKNLLNKMYKVTTIERGYGYDSTALLEALTKGLGAIKKFIIYKDRLDLANIHAEIFAVIKLARKGREFYGFVNIYQLTREGKNG